LSDEAEPKIGENRGNAGKGRPKGSPNKATAELKELAREYTTEALDALLSVMRAADGAAKVAAAREILDRGYGKASQVIAGDSENPLQHIHSIALVPVAAKRDDA
jgi:hypothetical protein